MEIPHYALFMYLQCISVLLSYIVTQSIEMLASDLWVLCASFDHFRECNYWENVAENEKFETVFVFYLNTLYNCSISQSNP